MKLTVVFCNRYFETKQLYCETEQLYFETKQLFCNWYFEASRLYFATDQLYFKTRPFFWNLFFETPKVRSPPDHQPSVRMEDSVFLPLPRFRPWSRASKDPISSVASRKCAAWSNYQTSNWRRNSCGKLETVVSKYELRKKSCEIRPISSEILVAQS